MRVSIGFPTAMEGLTYPIPFSDVAALERIAEHAEALGYDSIWGNDHMTTQAYVRDEFGQAPRFWDPIVTYAFLAAKTTRLRFGTGVLVLPMRRDIVVVAKQICTLDHLSGGRLEVAVGVGAYREEFDALHPDLRAHRGDMLEEGVRALRTLFSESRASFAGTYYRFSDVELYPKPLQAHLPIYFGGNNAVQIRRAALFGDGWVPAALPLERLRSGVVELRRLAEQQGRDVSALEIAPQYIACIDTNPDRAVALFRQSQMHQHLQSLRQSTFKGQADMSFEDDNLIGTPQAVVEKCLALKEAGVTHLLGTYFAVNDVSQLLDQMSLFAEEVVPHIVD